MWGRAKDPWRRLRVGSRRRLAIVVLLAPIAFVLLVAVSAPLWLKLTPTLHLNPPSGGDSIVIGADGTEIARVSTGTRLELLGDGPVPKNIKMAVIASEDARFYSHVGVDPIGLGRAVYSNLRGRPIQGASTITQQLVRNETSIGTKQTISRKAIEAMFALRLETQHDKEWILHRYLDTVWLGNSQRGAATAARSWFGVSIEDLNIGQAASIAATLPCPEACNPVDHPVKAEERRQRLIDILERSGELSRAQVAKARVKPELVYVELPRTSTGDRWVLDTVRRELLAAGVAGFTDDGQWPGGLRIVTTIDPKVQTASSSSVLDVLGRPGSSALDLEAAVAVVEPGTGKLRAIIGGRDFETRQVNIALGRRGGGSGRQGGSTAKTFAVVAAMEAGLDSKHTVAAAMQVKIGNSTVTNADWANWGSISIDTAARHSVNTAFVNLATELGPDRVADVATRLGVRMPSTVDERVVLGLIETDPVAMAGVYAALAADGYWVAPYVVEQAVRDGQVLYKHKAKAHQAVTPEVAQATVQVLRDVVRYGTGYRASTTIDGRRVDTFGKTGTTNNSADTWFVAANSALAAAVWIGNPVGNKPTRPVPGFETASGGAAPAKIWHDIMTASLVGPVASLSAPERAFTPSRRPATSTIDATDPSMGLPTDGSAPGDTSTGDTSTGDTSTGDTSTGGTGDGSNPASTPQTPGDSGGVPRPATGGGSSGESASSGGATTTP